jgi:hypothetical protein
MESNLSKEDLLQILTNFKVEVAGMIKVEVAGMISNPNPTSTPTPVTSNPVSTSVDSPSFGFTIPPARRPKIVAFQVRNHNTKPYTNQYNLKNNNNLSNLQHNTYDINNYYDSYDNNVTDDVHACDVYDYDDNNVFINDTGLNPMYTTNTEVNYPPGEELYALATVEAEFPNTIFQPAQADNYISQCYVDSHRRTPQVCVIGSSAKAESPTTIFNPGIIYN